MLQHLIVHRQDLKFLYNITKHPVRMIFQLGFVWSNKTRKNPDEMRGLLYVV